MQQIQGQLILSVFCKICLVENIVNGHNTVQTATTNASNTAINLRGDKVE